MGTTVELSEISRICEETRLGGHGIPFSVVTARWRSHMDLNPHVWRKRDIRQILEVLANRHPAIEVEPSVGSLLSGTDYWVKR